MHDPELSLVIPCYNEANRIGPTIEAVLAFLTTKPYASEVILVLDGCTDDTARVLGPFAGRQVNCDVRIVENPVNRGKGACTRQGMLAASGQLRIFTDADLSYPISGIDRFVDELQNADVVIASRETSGIKYATMTRRAITTLSRFVMDRFFVRGIPDTQAGFKGFRADVARDLFGHQRVNGFGFDAEILYVAQMRKYRIVPVVLSWEDVPGSKVRIARDVPKMALELCAILANRAQGRYG